MVKLTSNIHENYDNLLFLIDSVVVDGLKQKYATMLAIIERDQKDANEVTYLGFKRSPAAKGYHHNFEGGLVYHILEMYAIWEEWSKTFDLEDQQFLTNDKVLRAIINHDLHKGYCTYIQRRKEPFETEYGHHKTDVLLPQDVKTIMLLMSYGISLDEEMMNALLMAQGGFSEIQAPERSVLAVVVYLLDEFSANVLSRIEKGTMLDGKGKLGIFKRG